VSTEIGKTGVVGILRNGNGPTVMLRADMDALPVHEKTGLLYASEVIATDQDGGTVPVMHACGHDMHVTWLLGAVDLFAKMRSVWHGTLIAVFQPGEETASGARAMIQDGLFTRFPKPDIILGQHVMAGPAGTIRWRSGVITAASDILRIRLFGRGAHGSMPQASVDSIVMAAATVMRLQTIVSREIGASEPVVLTIGSLHSGTSANIIPDDASFTMNIRTFDEIVRKRVLAAVTRIVRAEADASRAPQPPEITPAEAYSRVVNDPEATRRVVDSFRAHFSEDRIMETRPISASEDFGSFGEELQVPSVYWIVGGTNSETYAKAKMSGRMGDVPTNHSPHFAPIIHPTLQTGVEAFVCAAGEWLFS
jgi:hippurate hydrolase